MITRRKETVMALIAAVVILLLLWLTSCSTKKTVTEYITIHDTLTVHKSDTVKDVVYKERIDTLMQYETHTYTLNNVGDTVKEIHHYHETEKTIVVDSTERYQSKVDSLQRIVNSQKSKETVKTKIQVPWKWICFILLTIIVVITLVTIDKKT